MKVLLDTRVFLWRITNDPRISLKVSAIMEDGGKELFLSAASIWEIVIKSRLGRLQLPENPDSYLAEQMALNAVEPLSITIPHALRVYNLPDIHKDPFDRIMISQALLEDMPMLTRDDCIPKYGVQTIW